MKIENYLRLFIAVKIPEEVKTEIEGAQEELRRALLQARIRWTKREQFHLTLRFLGNVEAERAGAVAEALRRACQGFSAFELRAEHIGSFPNWRLPRVIWAKVHDGGEELIQLQRAVETATQDFTTEQAEEKFTGH